MSVGYTPVQWGFNKYCYDAVVLGAVALYVILFIQFGNPDADVTRPVDGAIVRMRAFGTCAFLMLTVILCIGPLARLDRRFLPLLYNRRHVGVITALVALTHAVHVLNWYFVFAPTPKLEALLTANTSFDALLGFPFEVLGMFALLVLGILAATSHDFWLSFLGAPLWKRLHLLIYPAYAAVVAHAGLSYFQDSKNPTFGILFVTCGVLVAMLHLAALHLAARAKRGMTTPGAVSVSTETAGHKISLGTQGDSDFPRFKDREKRSGAVSVSTETAGHKISMRTQGDSDFPRFKDREKRSGAVSVSTETAGHKISLGTSGDSDFPRFKDREKRSGIAAVDVNDGIEVGRVGTIRDKIPDGRAVILPVAADRHVAVFRVGDALSAVSNACAHQNGPLGEGRVIDGCVTCPWHGFQYRLSDGCSPPPFTEKVPTYILRLADDRIVLSRTANPPGTPVPPLVLPAA